MGQVRYCSGALMRRGRPCRVDRLWLGVAARAARRLRQRSLGGGSLARGALSGLDVFTGGSARLGRGLLGGRLRLNGFAAAAERRQPGQQLVGDLVDQRLVWQQPLRCRSRCSCHLGRRNTSEHTEDSLPAGDSVRCSGHAVCQHSITITLVCSRVTAGPDTPCSPGAQP